MSVRRDGSFIAAKLRNVISQFKRVSFAFRRCQHDARTLNYRIPNFNFIAADFNLAFEIVNALRRPNNFALADFYARRSRSLIFIDVKAAIARRKRQAADCNGIVARSRDEFAINLLETVDRNDNFKFEGIVRVGLSS